MFFHSETSVAVSAHYPVQLSRPRPPAIFSSNVTLLFLTPTSQELMSRSSEGCKQKPRVIAFNTHLVCWELFSFHSNKKKKKKEKRIIQNLHLNEKYMIYTKDKSTGVIKYLDQK